MHPLTCSIHIKDDIELVRKVFLAEDKEFNNTRSLYKLQKEKDELIIHINAKDPTALRATITSVTRILNIVYKTR